jgi:hypothetical protein
MRMERRETARNGWHRFDLRRTAEGAVAGLGAAIAIGAMEWLSLTSHFPLVIIPFATSIVLVIGSPDAEPAQPRALIGGHIVATLTGIAMLQLTGPHAWAAAAAVGVAIVAMVVTGTFHPPAGINPPAGGFQQPRLVISVRASVGGRRAACCFCLCLAPLDPSPAVAATLVLTRLEQSRGHPSSQPGVLALALQEKLIAVTVQHDVALVEGLKRRAMADRDDGGCRQSFLEQTIEPGFRGFIE